MAKGAKKESGRKYLKTERIVFDENGEVVYDTFETYKPGDKIPKDFDVGDFKPVYKVSESIDDIGLEDFINGAIWDTKNKRTSPKAKQVIKQLLDFAEEMDYETDPLNPNYILKVKMTDLVGESATYRDFFQDFANYLSEKGTKGIGSTFGALKTGANVFKEVAISNVDIDSNVFKALESNYTTKAIGQKVPFLLSRKATYQRGMAADTFNTYFKGKLDEDDPMTEEINQKIIEK